MEVKRKRKGKKRSYNDQKTFLGTFPYSSWFYGYFMFLEPVLLFVCLSCSGSDEHYIGKFVCVFPHSRWVNPNIRGNQVMQNPIKSTIQNWKRMQKCAKDPSWKRLKSWLFSSARGSYSYPNLLLLPPSIRTFFRSHRSSITTWNIAAARSKW